MDKGIRVGPKKPSMSVKTSVATGKPSATENCSPHNPTGNRTVSGGQSVHGMPLMSAAAAKVK
jgi:hypothetical protein